MKTVSRKALTILPVAAVAGALALTGCGNKFTQQFQDAPRTHTINSAPAEIITNPDGFSNEATKCDHGNRLYTLFHSNSSYGGVTVVPHDPSCKQ